MSVSITELIWQVKTREKSNQEVVHLRIVVFQSFFFKCTICGRRGHTAGRCWRGSAGNFNDRSIAHSLRIPIVPVDIPLPVHALDSRPLGLISEATAPLGVVMREDYSEKFIFPLLILLRFPWFWAYPGWPVMTPLFRGSRGLSRVITRVLGEVFRDFCWCDYGGKSRQGLHRVHPL
jgi:hypothetical protein